MCEKAAFAGRGMSNTGKRHCRQYILVPICELVCFFLCFSLGFYAIAHPLCFFFAQTQAAVKTSSASTHISLVFLPEAL